MANPQRFREFVQEIATYVSEWEYEDGSPMNDDAYSFMQYIEALEDKVASQQPNAADRLKPAAD